MKFSTILDSDELYCVTKKKKKTAHIAYQFAYWFIFLSLLCQRFLDSYCSQCFQILCTPSGRQSVLCK